MKSWVRPTVRPTVATGSRRKAMTGVGIEPTTYGLKGDSKTAPNPDISVV